MKRQETKRKLLTQNDIIWIDCFEDGDSSE